MLAGISTSPTLVPSKCAADLQSGAADIGIIPAAAYTLIPDLFILPGVAIASKAPVQSILLLSKVPVEKVKSVAARQFIAHFSSADQGAVQQMVGRPPAVLRLLPPEIGRCWSSTTPGC